VTTLERLLPGGKDAGRQWPDPRYGGPQGVLLVCRSNYAGLTAASNAALQWASGYTPAHLALWGLVVVADAPGKLPKPLQAHLQRLQGTVQRLFRVGWVDAWRTTEPTFATASRDIAEIGLELQSRPWIEHRNGR